MGKLLVQASGLVMVLGSTATAQVIQRVSVSSSGGQTNNSSFECTISADGRYVAFLSPAQGLVPGDTNNWEDFFVRDRWTGTTERVNVSSGGTQANFGTYDYTSSISADGRFVAFASEATNLVPGDTNGDSDVFVRDRQLGTTERVSINSGGTQGDSDSYLPSISDDGRFVAIWSFASNLVPADSNGAADIFVRDRLNGTTERANLSTGGTQADLGGQHPSISVDGRFVAFMSGARNLVPGDTNDRTDVFVRDRQLGTTERASVDSGGAQSNFDSYWPSISSDGRYVAFQLAGASGVRDVYVRDRQGGTTERASIPALGGDGNANSGDRVSISADGRFVAFLSRATNMVPGDTNGTLDVFVRDRQSGTTERVNVDWEGRQGATFTDSGSASISADGRFVAFFSTSRLVPGDTNGFDDDYVRELLDGTNFTSLCEPGVAGVIVCPCANPPGAPNRGCDNSSATGGAVLSASGGNYLSSDSLVFTTSGEKSAALSIVLQGNALTSSGTIFGQGVRCASGALKRIYTKSAAGGSITAPDFDAGEPAVSLRSAALGDPIQSGQSRWYLVYYRDPIVLGGCPASSTFNATQTGKVRWSP